MIDLARLKSLMGDDEKMVERFLTIFKDETPLLLDQLMNFISEESWEEASIKAHAIKNQCGYLGLTEIADQAFKIEQLIEGQQDLGIVPGLVVRLEEDLKKMMRRL